MTHCTLICNLVDELCPESTPFSLLAMKGIHMSSSVEKMVQMPEVKWDESHACPGREAGLGTWAANVELEEGALQRGRVFPKAGRGRKISPSTVHCIENVWSGEWRTFVFLILGVYNLLGSVVKLHGIVAEHRVCFWEYHTWKPCFGVWHLGFESVWLHFCLNLWLQ